MTRRQKGVYVYIPCQTKLQILPKHMLTRIAEKFVCLQVLQKLLPKGVDIPSSFEAIGHIAHLNLREQHEPHKLLIAKILIDKNPAIKTVVNKVRLQHMIIYISATQLTHTILLCKSSLISNGSFSWIVLSSASRRKDNDVLTLSMHVFVCSSATSRIRFESSVWRYVRVCAYVYWTCMKTDSCTQFWDSLKIRVNVAYAWYM